MVSFLISCATFPSSFVKIKNQTNKLTNNVDENKTSSVDAIITNLLDSFTTDIPELMYPRYTANFINFIQEHYTCPQHNKKHLRYITEGISSNQ